MVGLKFYFAMNISVIVSHQDPTVCSMQVFELFPAGKNITLFGMNLAAAGLPVVHFWTPDDLTKFTQDTADDGGDWLWLNSATYSVNTGPSAGVGPADNDGFIYYEASGPYRQSAKARFVKMQSTSHFCYYLRHLLYCDCHETISFSSGC